MTGRLFVFLAGALVAASPLQGQAGPVDRVRCPDGTRSGPLNTPDQTMAAQDACQKAIDLFQYLAPQLGASLAGGNATLGQGSTLGGLGHFSVGLRLNVVQGSLPEMVTPSVNGAQSTPYETNDQIIGLPTADLAIGLFKGIPLALTNVGGVDLLASASYLPEFDGDGVSVRVPDGSLKLGYGIRVGLLQESLIVPGISATYLRRELPTTTITATSGPDELTISDFSMKTDSWRVVASKSLLFLGVAVGGGQDKYKSSTDISAHVAARAVPPSPEANMGPVSLAQTLTRSNVFGNVSMNLLLLKLTAEVGQVSGGEIITHNTFNGKQADDSRIYGSIGARFGF